MAKKLMETDREHTLPKWFLVLHFAAKIQYLTLVLYDTEFNVCQNNQIKYAEL